VPLAAVASLLILAGLAKLRSPVAAVAALASAGLPARRAAVRAVALAEICLGGWAIGFGGRLAAVAVALVYALFTALSGLLARRASSCGCFGSLDAPATAWHVGLSGVLALLAGGCAVADPHPLTWFAAHAPGLGAGPLRIGVLAAAAVAGAYALMLAYT
jgi:hypothetical protein